MILIIGGAFQGKKEFAVNELKIKNIYDNFHIAAKKCMENNEDINALKSNIMENYDAVICDEIGCGIVPIDKNERIFREKLGRILCNIAKECNEVWRVYAGIGVKIKG